MTVRPTALSPHEHERAACAARLIQLCCQERKRLRSGRLKGLQTCRPLSVGLAEQIVIATFND